MAHVCMLVTISAYKMPCMGAEKILFRFDYAVSALSAQELGFFFVAVMRPAARSNRFGAEPQLNVPKKKFLFFFAAKFFRSCNEFSPLKEDAYTISK